MSSKDTGAAVPRPTGQSKPGVPGSPVGEHGGKARVGILAAARRTRLLLVGALALSLTVFFLQLTVVRPYAAPAGAGLSLSGLQVLGSLGSLYGVAVIRPPDVRTAAGVPVVIEVVEPGGAADRAGIAAGMRVQQLGVVGDPPLDVAGGPDAAPDVLRLWRSAYWLGAQREVSIAVTDAAGGTPFAAILPRLAVWQVDAGTRASWLRRHGGTLLQMGAFIAGALILVALGTRGATAALMTLALLGAGVANGGLLWGGEAALRGPGAVPLVFVWLVTPLAFPVIGLAILHFPRRAPILTRHPWIPGALAVTAAPMLVANASAAIYLLGADAIGPVLAWLATNRWTFDLSFALALAANVAIAVEGVQRYRSNPDASERRRILIVVLTGVPAVLAYAVLAGVPLLSSWLATPFILPLTVSAVLEAAVLLPAFGLPYAVAVRHVFSPRTVLRQSLQYALARKTLSALVVLPSALLVLSLLQQRDRPLGDIILGRPLSYVAWVGLLVLGLRYRDVAQQWLDRRFFRAEYDAREIMVSLASRVPYESDPRELVALVVTQIDRALHPESMAVLAGEGTTLDVIAGVRTEAPPLSTTSALITLLNWSDQPLDVGVADDRSAAARLPEVDRAWVERSGSILLVPVLTGSGADRALIGAIALGPKRSEEPYTNEDRQLLRNIGAQMSVALDLSRLRRKAAEPAPTSAERVDSPTRASSDTALAGVGICPTCRRVVGLAERRCPEHQVALDPVPGLPALVDAKYRIDALVGRGGMGSVFQARDMRLERDVALKIVRADLVAAPDARARFRREAQIVARLQHPGIVTVFDYGTLPDGAAFLVMELVRGDDLRSLLKREHRLDPARAVALVSGVAAGVDAAHAAGVLHRDLKPENVLLPTNGTEPKVLDFGVAKMTDAATDIGTTQTAGGTIVGTPAYMAPEQLRGEAVDGRADVYSLGVMAYEMVTGRLPYGAGSFMEVALRQASGGTAVTAEGLPPALATPVLSALAFDRSARPATPGAFAEALRQGLGLGRR